MKYIKKLIFGIFAIAVFLSSVTVRAADEPFEMQNILNPLIRILNNNELQEDNLYMNISDSSISLFASSTIVDTGIVDNITWTLYSDGLLELYGSGEIPALTEYYNGITGYILKNSTTATIIDTSEIKNIYIPDSITSLGYGAFRGCSNVSNITIPDSVISIGREAFWEWRKLVSVNIPYGVTSINQWTFYNCRELQSITIPNSVTSIGYQAFAACKSLTGITIPDSVASMDSNTFHLCDNLKDIYIKQSENAISGSPWGASNATVHWLSDISECTVSVVSSTYTGDAITPVVTVKNGSTILEQDTDYTIAYSNNINVGTAKAIITGIGNYTGTKSVTFSITARAISYATIGTVASQTYSGNAITPTPSLTYNSKTLKKDTDYTLTYRNNVNAGTATITITGKGNFSGTTTKTFTIAAKAISYATVGTVASQTYSGNAITPTPSLTYNSKTLKKDTDYTLTYSNNVNAGTATITITGKGNFSGTASKTFSITPKSSASLQISSIPNQTYTGSQIKPSVVITDLNR